MASEGESQVFRLVSRDGPSYTVKKAAVTQLHVVQNIFEDLPPEQNEVIVPTPNVDSKTLEKIVRWCNEHVRVEEIDLEVIKRWEDEFVGELTLDELYDLLEASNYLAAKALLHRLCGRVADMIRGKTPDEIRAVFGIKNDFSEEQQVEINRKNSWAWTTHDVERISEPKGYWNLNYSLIKQK